VRILYKNIVFVFHEKTNAVNNSKQLIPGVY